MLAMCLAAAAGCTGVTSPIAEKVTLYQAEGEMPADCEQLGEVSASVCEHDTLSCRGHEKGTTRKRLY
jgi:hypothetical protein